MLAIYLHKNSRCLISGWKIIVGKILQYIYIGLLFIQAHIKNIV